MTFYGPGGLLQTNKALLLCVYIIHPCVEEERRPSNVITTRQIQGANFGAEAAEPRVYT